MNSFVPALSAAVAALVYWGIAATAAKARRLSIGTLPPLLLIVVSIAAAIASAEGIHGAAIAALSGVAVAGLIDARTGSIFDALTVTILGVSIALCVPDRTALSGAYGAASTGGALLLLYAVTRGTGLGLGDVKLGTALGAALGVTPGLTVLGLAFIFGAIYGAYLLVARRARPGSALRFGPFLAAGTFVTVLVPLGYDR